MALIINVLNRNLACLDKQTSFSVVLIIQFVEKSVIRYHQNRECLR